MRAAVISLLPLLAAAQPAGPQPGLVRDCQPCTLKVAADLPPYAVRFQVAAQPGGGKRIESLAVSREGDEKPRQTLAVKDMMPVPVDHYFYFAAEDVNFDGDLDVILLVARGVQNTSCDYWLFERAKGEFAYLGRYPEFQRDPAARRLRSYETGGMGGRIFTSRDYAWEGGKLLLVREEKQTPVKGSNTVFTKVIRERRKGVLVVVSRQTVRER